MIELYTDGAYAPSRNKGGWAFIVVKDSQKIYHNFFPVENTTNNRMEIQAVIEGLKWCIINKEEELTIITDSMYVIGTMTKNWKRNQNSDLWKQLDKLVKKLTITWKHVKGHSGDKYNELCDIMAVEATK